MIKVLNIITDANIGGAGRVLMNYLKHRDRGEFDVSVALPRGSALLKPLGELDVKLYEVAGIAAKSFSLGAIGKLRRVVREADPDIVHTHGSLSGRIAGRREGRAVIFTRHSVFPVKPYMKKGIGRLLNRLVNVRYADRIVAVSPAARDNLTEAGVPEDRIEVVMNGVDAVERRSGEALEAFREKAGVRTGDFTAGILARIEDYKGHTDILEALKLLKGRGRTVKLLVAGAGSYEETVRKRTEELGLSDQVTFMGFVTDIAGFLSVLDVQLNASWGTEATSMSLLEGFSMGLPAVVSDYGGNPWVVSDGENGLIFPSRDTAALAERLERLMDDPALLQKLGGRARQVFEGRFTVDHFASELERVYRTTLEERKNHGKG